MAKLKANGAEFARFTKSFTSEHGTVVVEHSVRLKTFATKPAEIRIMRKSRWEGSSNWTSWKFHATARTRSAALSWHDRRDWVQLSGERERDGDSLKLHN